MALGNIKLRATSTNVTTQINGISAISSAQVTNAPLTHEQIDLNFLELANSIVNLSSTEGVTLANHKLMLTLIQQILVLTQLLNFQMLTHQA